MTRDEFDRAIMTAPFSSQALRVHDAEQRAEIERLTKERDNWHVIVRDELEADEEFRKVAGEWDTSDSYGVVSHADILERVLEKIEALKAQLKARDDAPPRAYLQDNWNSQA